MKIKSVRHNNRKRLIEIHTAKGSFSYPYIRLEPKPTSVNPIEEIYVDSELANEGITYTLRSGKEGSVVLDEFLDYNKDKDYLLKMSIYKLTLEAQKKFETSGMTKSELARALDTSPARISVLLDQTYYSKTIDQMLKLLAAMGYQLEWKLKAVI